MMAIPSFVEFLFIGVGFIILPIGTPAAAGELENRLFEACEAPYSYELAAWVLQAGADPNAASPEGETPLQLLLRQRYETSSRLRFEDNSMMLVLLLKSGARLPDSPPPGKNPVRWAAGRLDQVTWDMLALKFGEAELVRAGGWPTEPAATLALDDRTLALPPPDGFVPATREDVGKTLSLASVAALPPEAARFFVPAEQADSPLADITTVAGFISRRDILGLTREDDALLKALSLADEIDGRFFREYFNNTSYLTASPTGPIPWMPGEKEESDESLQIIVSSHGSLGVRDPYQLVYYRIFPSEGDATDDAMRQAYGMLAGWHFALRTANADEEGPAGTESRTDGARGE